MPDEQLPDDATISEPARRLLSDARRDAPRTVALARLDAEVDTLTRQHAAAATAPDASEVESACQALRSAAAAQADAERAADALSADRVQFLETSLEFRDRHGTQPCPVCATGSLDDEWVVRARAALSAEREAASALRVARSGAHRARQALLALVRAVDAPAPEDVDLPAVAAARVAHQSFTALPTDDDTALADRLERETPALRQAYAALEQAAAERLAAAREATAWLRALDE